MPLKTYIDWWFTTNVTQYHAIESTNYLFLKTGSDISGTFIYGTLPPTSLAIDVPILVSGENTLGIVQLNAVIKLVP